jgi:hypothetical protein
MTNNNNNKNNNNKNTSYNYFDPRAKNACFPFKISENAAGKQAISHASLLVH